MITPPLTLGYFSSNYASPRASPYLTTDPQSPFAYTEIVADAQDIEATYSNATLDFLGQTTGGRDQYGMRIGDDGIKPIMVIYQGIHGDEIDYAPGLSHWIREFCAQSTVEAQMGSASFAIYWVVTVNPDGMDLVKRENDNGVDLNRNWPLYWLAYESNVKGQAPFSEPESANIRDWFDTNNCTGRIRTSIDLHGWESRDEWGWICEQHYYSSQSEWLQRIGFLNYEHLVKQRDWSQYGWVDADPAFPKEYRSNSNPFAHTYARTRGADMGLSLLWEYPVGEKKSVICTAVLDVLDGLLRAHLDAERPEVPANFLGPAVTRLNDNPYFTNWSTTNERPGFFRKGSLTLTKYDVGGINNNPYIRAEKPAGFPWRYARSRMGYAQTEDYRITFGGENNAGYNSDDAVIEGELAYSGEKRSSNYPVDTEWNAGCSAPNNYVYAAGGFGDNGYLDQLYEGQITAATSDVNWTSVATLPSGLQRHSMEYIDGKVYVVGGRTSAGYTDQVQQVDLSDGSITNVGPLPQGPRGYLATGVINDVLYVFGGYNPSVGITGEVTTYDPTSNTWSTIGTMPLEHRKMASVNDFTNGVIYLWGGEDDNYNVSNKVYKVDSAGNFTEIVLDLAQIINDDGTTNMIPSPYRAAGAMFYIADRDQLLLVGGEDDAGTKYDDVYTVELLEENFTHRRGVDTGLSYGWLRSNNVFYGTAGDRFALTLVARAAQAYSFSEVPYIRLTLYVSDSNGLNGIKRKVRQWYAVPPKSEWGVYSLPVVLHEDEKQVRAYVRLYGDEVPIEWGTFQVYQTDVARPVPLSDTTTSLAADAPVSFSEGSVSAEKGYAPVPLQGYFGPMFGTNLENYVTVIEFMTAGKTGDNVVGARLKFDSRWEGDESQWLIPGFDYQIVGPDFGTWIFEVDFADGTSITSTVEAGKLNYTRLSRGWRRDALAWNLTRRTASSGSNEQLVLSIYWASSQKEMSVNLPADAKGEIVGYTYQPVGLLYTANTEDQPQTLKTSFLVEGDSDNKGNLVNSAGQGFVFLNGSKVAAEGATLDNSATTVNHNSFVTINGKPVADFGTITSEGTSMNPTSNRHVGVYK